MEKFGFFSEQLADGMSRQRFTAKGLAKRLGCSYEHVRRLSRSEALPSLQLLRQLCHVFQWNEEELSRLLDGDRGWKRFGDSYWLVLGKNPKCAPLYIMWSYLSDDERDYFLECLRYFVARKSSTRESRIPHKADDGLIGDI